VVAKPKLCGPGNMDSNVLLTRIENRVVRIVACFAVCIQGSIMLYTL
jgi:hypothetical protein